VIFKPDIISEKFYEMVRINNCIMSNVDSDRCSKPKGGELFIPLWAMLSPAIIYYLLCPTSPPPKN